MTTLCINYSGFSYSETNPKIKISMLYFNLLQPNSLMYPERTAAGSFRNIDVFLTNYTASLRERL